MNIYFYPKINYKFSESPNTYISDLENELGKYNRIVNKSFNKKGVLDLFKYFFITDTYLFNWIEDLASYRFGKLQIIFFTFFLFCAKFSGKKIVWILHNKYSHDRNKNRWTDFIFYLMIRKSHLILTHSTAGIDFIKAAAPSKVKKVKYFIHPVKPVFPFCDEGNKKEYDFFIWGTLYPYKGVLEFLQFLNDSFRKYDIKILLAGLCGTLKYKSQLTPYFSTNVTYYDKLLPLEEIAKLANRAKFTLFTYKSTSVLSSGSLMDSIRMGSLIIGPDHGAFKDLNSYSFMHTYSIYEDILKIRDTVKIDPIKIHTEIQEFCNKNSWSAFGENIQKELQMISRNKEIKNN